MNDELRRAIVRYHTARITWLATTAKPETVTSLFWAILRHNDVGCRAWNWGPS